MKENQSQYTCQLVRSFSRETWVAEVEAHSRSSGRHSNVYTVKLTESWCDCGEFQSLRLSCSHAIATCSTLILQLLGVAPTERQIMRQRVQYTRLESIYQQLHEDVDEEVVEQHARAFILRMQGEFLMLDTSGLRVYLMYLPLLDDLSETFDYSWGSTVSACLYRGLCHAAIFKDQKEVG
ncbi:hypothetical protein Lal_00013578 [Lupinus albus]|nr:hypothetical protein Lal_00013578 [Lupinus albus]